MKSSVDKKLLPMKAHYFLFNAGTAPVVPFMPTLARQLGFSSVIVGTIYTILPIVGMLAKPLFGAIADRFQRHKILFLLFQIMTAFAFFSIGFIPPITTSVEFHCDNGVSDFRFCPKDAILEECTRHKLEKHYGHQNVQCQLDCHAKPWMWEVVCKNWGIFDCDPKQLSSNSSLTFPIFLNMSQLDVIEGCLFFIVHGEHRTGKSSSIYCPSGQNNSYFKTVCDITCKDEYLTKTLTAETNIGNGNVIFIYQFWMFFIFLVISWCGMAVVVSVGDAICFEMLGERHYLYGNQRLWGAVGWGIFSIISGILVDKMSGGSAVKDYTIAFYLALFIILLDMGVSLKLKHTQTKLSTNIIKDVGTIFLSPRVLIFFIWCISVGLCTALIWNFLFWHLEKLNSMEKKDCDNQDFMKTLQGLAMGIQCFGGELPFFFLSGWILKKIGHINAMSLVLLGFGVRFILYSLLRNPWWVLPIEFMNGITFGIFYSTMASYASIVAPPGTEATLQGLVGAIFEGVGVSLGSLIGGILFDSIGGSQTFLLFGVCAIGAFFIHVLVQWLMQKYGGRHGKNITTTKSGDGDISEKSKQIESHALHEAEEDKFTDIDLNAR